jgi:hypothetical protein
MITPIGGASSRREVGPGLRVEFLNLADERLEVVEQDRGIGRGLESESRERLRVGREVAGDLGQAVVGDVLEVALDEAELRVDAGIVLVELEEEALLRVAGADPRGLHFLDEEERGLELAADGYGIPGLQLVGERLGDLLERGIEIPDVVQVVDEVVEVRLQLGIERFDEGELGPEVVAQRHLRGADALEEFLPPVPVVARRAPAPLGLEPLLLDALEVLVLGRLRRVLRLGLRGGGLGGALLGFGGDFERGVLLEFLVDRLAQLQDGLLEHLQVLQHLLRELEPLLQPVLQVHFHLHGIIITRPAPFCGSKLPSTLDCVGNTGSTGILQAGSGGETPGDSRNLDRGGGQRLLEIPGRRVAFRGRVRGQDHLVHAALLDPVQEPPDRELFWADPVEGGEAAVQDVVKPVVGAGLLDGAQVLRLLHDADHAALAPRVGADRARVRDGHVVAHRAGGEPLLDLAHRVGERERLLLGLRVDVEGQALGGLFADAGKFRKGLDQPDDRLCVTHDSR